ncbi:MAG: sulfatase-like hydrolase/transferase [Woeseia sp.]|nr:sulfatase-like hydrolase/transferase [Woeseia sp.]MBT6211257.1 sulfatase-like hydrolase/transferase [Woeseia sp.]
MKLSAWCQFITAISYTACGRRAKLAIPILIVLLSTLSLTARANETPNILFILSDDIGWGDIRSYNPESKVALPAIEQLAAEGLKFTDAHTSASKCAPSRYSVITGNYQWRGRKEWGQWNATGGSQILSGQQTLGGMLQQAGYKSAFVGKHHLGAEYYRQNSNEFTNQESLIDFSRTVEEGPLQRGFDYSFAAMRGIQDSPYAFFENDLLVGSVSDIITWAVGDYGDTEILKAGVGLSDWVTRDVGPALLDKAVAFIDQHHKENISRATKKPFFLYFNSEAVHSPRKPPISLGGRNILGESGVSLRTDMLVEVDVIVEQLLGALEARGLTDDTLVIFTSDNGAQGRSEERRAGHFSNGSLRGDKGTIYEGGHRVPLIIKGGARVLAGSPLRAGSSVDALVAIQDMYATLADLVGAPIVNGDARDSFSILPVLIGDATGPVRDHMISEADAPEDGSGDEGLTGRHKSYRAGRYKLIFNSSDQPVELYDLSNDLSETNNLINDANQRANRAALVTAYNQALVSDRTASVRESPSNLAPQVVIEFPASGSSFLRGATVSFMGSASDEEDGELGASLRWSSSIDGTLGTGPNISVILGEGQHVITVSVSDSGGRTASASIVVVVKINNAPVVRIITPADATSAVQGETIQFSATATDAEDGTLSSAIIWLSNRDGNIGSGASISTSTLSVGVHSISAKIVDSAGQTATATITLEVASATAPPSSADGGGGIIGLPGVLVLLCICIRRRRNGE